MVDEKPTSSPLKGELNALALALAQLSGIGWQRVLNRLNKEVPSLVFRMQKGGVRSLNAVALANCFIVDAGGDLDAYLETRKRCLLN